MKTKGGKSIATPNKVLGGPKPVAQKKRSRKRLETYSIYIYKLFKLRYPGWAMSSKAMNIMNSFVKDLFERIAAEASKLVQYSNSKTLTSREIKTAVRLVIPGELADHSVSEGTKALIRYSA